MPKVINDKAVFQAVIDVLSAYGYEKATTKLIAEAAGMHEATLFRKYRSKFNLIEQAINTIFSDVPLARASYTGDLQNDLLSIIKAYLKTSEMVGDILPILLVEISRNPELKTLLENPWRNVFNISNILEQYQAQGVLKKEPILSSISVLLGPLMVRHLITQVEPDMPITEIQPQEYVDNFLQGRLAKNI